MENGRNRFFGPARVAYTGISGEISLWKLISSSLFLAFLAGSICACAPMTQVYIPPEWQKPQKATPPTTTKTAPQKTARSPVIQPPADIKEKDVPASPSQAPSPGSTASGAASPAMPARGQTTAKTPSAKPPQPQHLASMHLVDQGRASLSQGRTEQAISLFEQAIQVDVYNGEAFYGLAQAWKRKGSPEKAMEFSRKAEVIFQDDPNKLKQVLMLEADLYKDMGNPGKADAYRQRAGSL